MRFRDFIFQLFGIIIVVVGVVAGIWIAEVVCQLTSRQLFKLPECTWLNQIVSECTTVYERVQVCTWVYQNIPECTRMYQNIPECFRLYPHVLE